MTLLAEMVGWLRWQRAEALEVGEIKASSRLRFCDVDCVKGYLLEQLRVGADARVENELELLGVGDPRPRIPAGRCPRPGQARFEGRLRGGDVGLDVGDEAAMPVQLLLYGAQERRYPRLCREGAGTVDRPASVQPGQRRLGLGVALVVDVKRLPVVTIVPQNKRQPALEPFAAAGRHE